jgi:Flp pilus assembly pilin Flp
MMKRMRALLSRLCRDDSGQDLIEYALMVATLAVVVAGFLPPTIMPAVSTIFSKITSSLAIS